MGQLFCKDCSHDTPNLKRGAFITWGADTTFPNQQRRDQDDDHHLHLHITTSNDDSNSSHEDHHHRSRQSKRVRHKKRNVALHAEFRDRFFNNSSGSRDDLNLGTSSVMAMASSSSFSYSVDASSSSVGSSESTGNLNNNKTDYKANSTAAAVDNSISSSSNKNDILAPPLCNAKIMVQTDNVFCGVECGVDTLHEEETTIRDDFLLSSSASYDSGTLHSDDPMMSSSLDGGDTNNGDNGHVRTLPQDNVTTSSSNNNKGGTNNIKKKKNPAQQTTTPIFPKTPQEETFLTSALTDTDTNFILDGIPPHLRQTLMMQMERISVPRHHVLIRKGDIADYLYLLYQGEIGVYIDPGECVEDDTMIDIMMSHSNHGSSSSSVSPNGGAETSTTATNGEGRRKNEFKQSYVLNLRKSLFQSTYNESASGVVGSNDGGNTILGQVISLVRRASFRGDESTPPPQATTPSTTQQSTSVPGSSSATATTASTLPTLIEEISHDDNDEAAEKALTQLNELQRLRHERDLGPMDVFGELGLIYNCPRTASCVTSTPCTLYRVKGEVFKSILSSSNADRERKRCTESHAALEALHNLGVMENWLDEKSVRDLESVLNPITFHRGDMVVTKGEWDKTFFFVMSGRLLAHDVGTGDSRKVDLELVEGNHFGGFNLLNDGPAVANVTVISPKVRLMAITEKDFNKRRASLEPLMKKLSQRNALLTIPVIAKSKLLPHEINKLVQKLEWVKFPRGTVAFSSEEMKSALYIMVNGKMQLIISNEDHGVVNTFEAPDHFGGRSLLDPKFFLSKNVQLRALIEGTGCLMLSRRSILEVIGNINRLGTPTVPVSRKLIKNMKRSDLKLHRIIGVGAFGRVWLASHKARKTVYALKVMDKKEIVANKMTKGVMREKNVLASVEHPFIVDLLSTFQDDYRVYMLQHYVQGGELLGLIYNVSKKGYLSNDAAAFYGACIVEALCHLHSRSIVHRDIKPENILIKSTGYVVLADFGFAKVVLEKTYTTCGSPEYMAPEMLLGKGHNWSVDHWALGVVLYEMLVGQTPFIHVGATKMTLFRRICRGKIAFPDAKKHGIDVHKDAKQLIASLLNKDIAARLGSSITEGDEPLRTNPWFQGLLTDFHHVFLNEKVSAPWCPNVNNELDTSYFDSHDELEKELISKGKKETPLDRKMQRMFEGF